VLALILVLAAAGCAADASWIHAKAALAQLLLERAWTRTLADGGTHRPWAWADTAPVARLTAPAHGIGQIVLAGDSGRTLAFGPGWAPASAAPGTPGTTIISGHRDTHFAWLKALAIGDRLELDGAAGRRAYRVVATHVADASRERIGVDADTDAVLLVTCWPFDAVVAGGPLRYLVTAVSDD
jgi:sortase A